MKRFAALFCLLLLFGSGCGSQAAPLRSVTALQLAVQRGLSSEALAGLDVFVRKTSALSNGELEIEVIKSDDVLASLDQGTALILASNDEIARANANFNSYTSPFYFYDYTHLSLTLNSQRFSNIIADGTLSLLGALPIAAFYDGNSVLVSSGMLSLDTVDQYDGTDVTISNDPVFAELLRGMGARVRIREEESQRIETFNKGGDRVIECRVSSLSALQELPNRQPFFVCQTFHRAEINWLMLSQDTKQKLSAYDLAVLTEAAAFAVAKNDELVLESEKTALSEAEGIGGDVVSVIFGEFFDHTERILRASARYGTLWDWEQYLEIQEITTKNIG